MLRHLQLLLMMMGKVYLLLLLLLLYVPPAVLEKRLAKYPDDAIKQERQWLPPMSS
jgi:hypothetical protein